jgi:FtsH-binding integral membrane protein
MLRQQSTTEGKRTMPTPTTARVVGKDRALTSHLNQVFNYMSGGVAISGLVAWLTSTNPALLNIAMKGNLIWFLGVLALAFFLQRIVFSLQPAAGLAVFAGFSAVMGFALSPLAIIYTGSSIATAFAVAAIMFAGTAAYGYFTQKSLSGWGTFLIMGVWGLVGVSLVTLVVGLFGVNTGPMSTVINLIAVPLFAGMTAWEVNTIKETFATYGRDELLRSRLAILQATSLYISFINMFVSLLQLMGSRR